MVAQNALNIVSSGIVTYNGAGSFTALTNPLTVANGGTGRATLTNHGVLVGAGTSAITQLAVGATNSVMVGSTGADPSFSTSSTSYFTAVSFDSGSNLLNTYTVGSFTPTIVGGSTAGTTTYADQHAYYTRIGNLVTISTYILVNSVTGTGQATYTSLPFTVKNQTSYNVIGHNVVLNAPLGATNLYTFAQGVLNTTTAIIFQVTAAGVATSFDIAAPVQTAYYLLITYQI